MSLILTAHGSRDARSAATIHRIAHEIRCARPDLDVRVAFCEQNEPNLRDVLPRVRAGAVVVPLLLADAYHARVDIPGLIADAGTDTRQADVLGEDPRLISVLRQRVTEAGFSRLDGDLGVIVTAVGSSHAEVNARTAGVAALLSQGTCWQAETAYATGPQPGLDAAADRLRERGAHRLVIAPWFLAHGRITDRIAEYAGTRGIAMAHPLGAHPDLAATVLDRYHRALAAVVAA